VAKERSDDPGSKDSGGELGFAGRGQFVREFEDAVRALAIGQISDPIRTKYGYHVIQLEERRAPEQTDLVKRYFSYGFTATDLKAQARYEALRTEFGRRQEATLTTSPTEQVHLAKILVNLPSPAGGDYQGFLDALNRQTAVRQKLEAGTDFAEVAKTSSDDTDSKANGGDIGWVSRGMLPDPQAEELVFGAEVGKVTEPVSTSRDWTVYKIVEKAPSRELTEDQKTKVEQSAYPYWLARQKRAYGIQTFGPL
jgi:parvulin-like peptidyl-prolyl isomerase